MSSSANMTQDGSSIATFNARDDMYPTYKRRKTMPDLKYKDNKGANQQNNDKVKKEKFPGRKPIPKETLEKYNYGPGMERGPKLSHTGRNRRQKMVHKEATVEEGRRETARAEVLLTEQSGCVEAVAGFSTMGLTQREIVEASDITTKCKRFELKLDHFGPYKFEYFRDGRHLAMAGKMGHLTNFNWLTKKLTTEVNIMEQLYDVTFLQDHRTLAVAQKDWVSVYDEVGTEIHCVRQFYNINKLDYLPYHFLLAGMSKSSGMLHYLDVSLGKEVHTVRTHNGAASYMCHNPYNGVVSTSHVNGMVAMWTPNSSKPVASMLAHKAPITTMNYDPRGRYLITSSNQREVHIWDARNLGTVVHQFKTQQLARQISISQTGLIALGFDRDVQIYRGLKENGVQPYMKQQLGNLLSQIQFCPFEDVLGITTRDTFTSIIIPGAGEANFDASEINPYSSKSNRREALIKGLLAKIPSDLITLDPASITQVDVPTLEEKLEQKRKLIYVNVPRINPQPKYRMKGKSGSAQMAKRKMIKKDKFQRHFLDKVKKDRLKAGLENPKENGKKDVHRECTVLDRFK